MVERWWWKSLTARPGVGKEVPHERPSVREVHRERSEGGPEMVRERGPVLRFLFHVIADIRYVSSPITTTVECRWSGGHLTLHDYIVHPLHGDYYVLNEFGYYRLRLVGKQLKVLLPTGVSQLIQPEMSWLHYDYQEFSRDGFIEPAVVGSGRQGNVVALRRDRVIVLKVPITFDNVNLDQQYLLQKNTGDVVVITNLDTGRRWPYEIQPGEVPVGYDERSRILLTMTHSGIVSGYRDRRRVLTYRLSDGWDTYIRAVK